jgi:hypothetical protein
MVNHIGFNLACIVPGVQQVLGGIAAIGYTAQIIGSLRDRVNLCGHKKIIQKLENSNLHEIDDTDKFYKHSNLKETFKELPEVLETAKEWTKIYGFYKQAEERLTHKEKIAYVKTEILKEKYSPKLNKLINNLGIAILLAIPVIGSIAAIAQIDLLKSNKKKSDQQINQQEGL